MEHKTPFETQKTDCTLEESQHLEKVLAQAQFAYAAADALMNQTDASYDEVAKHLISVRGEMDGHEMKLNKLELIRMGRQAELAEESKEKISKVLESPYFARIDFIDEGENVPQTSYIGRFAFTWDGKPVVSDWRSPIAGLFYDFDLGPAFFETPAGKRQGTLSLKRQFRIENGKLVYAVDSNSAAQDEILALELSRSTEPQMRTIVSSIQQEQNAIIRDEQGGTLIIQGVAGSGKTSIALHHIAYLLYRQKDKLRSSNVAIISPSQVFSDYIGNVLPELGEEPVQQWSMHELATILLKGIAEIKAPEIFDSVQDNPHFNRAEQKTTEEFALSLTAFLDEVLTPKGATTLFKGIKFEVGDYTVSASWLDKRFEYYAPIPILERLELMAEDILHEAKGVSYGFKIAELPNQKQIIKQLQKMLIARGPLALYKQFLTLNDLAAAFKAPAKNTVEWEDAFPLILCRLVFEGRDDLPEIASIHHLVIDEMQDLAFIQHAAISRLFTNDKTILGDVNQLVDGRTSVELEAVRKFYPDSRLVNLMRSYRSSYEINQLAQKIKPVANFEAVKRHGEAPSFIQCGDTRGALAAIHEAIVRFRESGHRNLGILCKSDMLAERYGELLAIDENVTVLSDQTAEFPNGIVVSSIRLAKGLEFDEVIILDADTPLYHTEADRNLLYVAITRALHRLTILYRTQLSLLLT